MIVIPHGLPARILALLGDHQARTADAIADHLKACGDGRLNVLAALWRLEDAGAVRRADDLHSWQLHR